MKALCEQICEIRELAEKLKCRCKTFANLPTTAQYKSLIFKTKTHIKAPNYDFTEDRCSYCYVH